MSEQETEVVTGEVVTDEVALETDSKYEAMMLEAFVQKDEKVPYYQAALEKMTASGELRFQWHWSWWAFAATWAYLWYRRVYLPAAIVFVVSLVVPVIGIVIMIIMGGVGPYFVVRRYYVLKREMEQKYYDPKERIEEMRDKGGFHYWVVWIMVILSAFYLIGIVGAVLKAA